MHFPELKKIFEKALAREAFPGALLGVLVGSGSHRYKLVKGYGYTSYRKQQKVDSDVVYDLASLTKPLATLSCLLSLCADRRLDLAVELGDIFCHRRLEEEKAKITIRQLLCHSSGLPGYRPWFRQLALLPLSRRRQAMLEKVLSEPLAFTPGSRAEYSDLGFFLLGVVVEEMTGQSLDRFFAERICKRLGIEEEIFFNRLGNKRKRCYAAGEFCSWRQRLMVGEVSDEHCWILGGVAGHAGLFASIDGVLSLGGWFLDQWRHGPDQDILPDLRFRPFGKRQQIQGSSWALGFDTPSASGSSSGRFFSPSSIGHLGFTGTSLWIDPEKELVVALLSNRVHPSRENRQIKEFRPLVHDTLLRELGMAKEKKTSGLKAQRRCSG